MNAQSQHPSLAATLQATDYADCVGFLRAFHPDGPWLLTAIDPKHKGTDTRTFGPESEQALLEWLDRHEGSWNLYFSVGRPLFPMSKKAKREDIKEVSWLHVDLDPRANEDLQNERTRILSLLQSSQHELPPPSCVVFSGGGYQAFWCLREPIWIGGDLIKAEDAKLYNLKIETLLGGDNCHNIDRIMRLPGTLNIPDARKAKKGRIPTQAALVELHPDRIYSIEQFTKANALQQTEGGDVRGEIKPRVQVSGTTPRLTSVDDLDQWNVPDRVKVIVREGHQPGATKKGDNSRSGWLYDCVCQLVRHKVPAEIIHAVLTDPKFAISESVLANGARAERYAIRQVERATEAATDFSADQHGVPNKSQGNIRIALARLGVSLSHNLLTGRILIDGLELSDSGVSRLYLEVDEKFRFRPSKDFFWMVIEDEARKCPFHPIRDYLSSLSWDGVARIDSWLVRYGGAVDTPYTRAVGALVLIAAVRRVRQPGVKFDEMVVLESPQGQNKSTALQILAVRDEWFSDDLPFNSDSKVVIERLHGHWIVEAAELKGLRQGHSEHLKAFLSRSTDCARLAYGRVPTVVPRQCVFVGTTNSQAYLRDSSGNRRFWPVRVNCFDVAQLKADVDQLWAEAACREASGKSIRLSPSLWESAAAEQEERRVVDPIVERLADALRGQRGKLKAADVWRILNLPEGHRTADSNERVGDAMRELGWERTKRRFGGDPDWCYIKGESWELGRAIHVDAAGNVGEPPF